MKTLLICESVHHGNTKKIADAIAGSLGAGVIKPCDVDAATLGTYDLIGFGSGIYRGKHHKNLLSLVQKLPRIDTNAFIFSTAGGANENMKDHKQMNDLLAEKGFKVVDQFTCKGLDTMGPLFLVGGINKGKPDASDMEAAKKFAEKLKTLA